MATKKSVSARKAIKLPKLKHASEGKEVKAPALSKKDNRLGFAFVGLGTLTVGELLPATLQSKNVKVSALVSGDRSKALKLAQQYGVAETSIYDYENFDAIKDNPDVDVVYIVLPNSMHEEFTLRSAKAGKHVLTEKPMATSVASAKRMVDACKKAKVKLMVAYRMQYEPAAISIREMIDKKKYGDIRLVESVNVQNTGPSHWRLDKVLAGGGALMDIGIYNLNTTRFLLGEEPESVYASTYSTPDDKRFSDDVEETMMFQLFFPGGAVANNVCSYGVSNHKHINSYGDNGGKFLLDNAFAYNGRKLTEVFSKQGVDQQLTHGAGKEKNQFALEMDHMAECVRQNKEPYTRGEEGLQDQVIMEALYKSAKSGKVVKLKAVKGKDVFRGTKPTKS